MRLPNKLVGKSLTDEQLGNSWSCCLCRGGVWGLPRRVCAGKLIQALRGWARRNHRALFITINTLGKLMFSALPLESKERSFQKVLAVLITFLMWCEENRIRVLTDSGKIPATLSPFSNTLHHLVLSFTTPFKREMEVFFNVS